MKLRSALPLFVVCYCCLQTSIGGAQENTPGSTPAPTAKSACNDAITSVQYAAPSLNFAKLEKKEVEARLQDIARRASTDPRVLEQLECMMKRITDDR
jgi:hypothetical protein